MREKRELPGQIVEQTEHILQSIVPCRLVTAAVCGPGQVIG